MSNKKTLEELRETCRYYVNGKCCHALAHQDGITGQCDVCPHYVKDKDKS